MKSFAFISACLALASLWITGCSSLPEQDHKGMNSTQHVSAQDDHVRIMGRTNKNSDGSRTSAYPGVSYFLQVKGSSLTMDASSNNGQAWVDVIVDNGAPQLIQLGQKSRSYTLFQLPVAGEHQVRVTLRTETWQSISTISGFTLKGGMFLAAPPLPMRKIMVLGDSITCGEMIDRVAGEERNSRWSNARDSYGMLTAKALNAQVNLVCYGGRGLIRSWNGRTDELNLPDFYPLSVPDQQHPLTWDKSQYIPDLIIVAIGTNDFSQGIPERAIYVNAYVNFLQRVLKDYPQAQIALTESAILEGDKKARLISYIADTIQQLKTPRVHQLKATHFPGDTQDAHPTKAQHAAMAREITSQLKAIMSW